MIITKLRTLASQVRPKICNWSQGIDLLVGKVGNGCEVSTSWLATLRAYKVSIPKTNTQVLTSNQHMGILYTTHILITKVHII